jgi:uncharacterized SAM-binding protein YcdF (DUF218 family)
MTGIPPELLDDVETLWDYHDMHHKLRPVDVAIGLGSHDIGVAVHTTELYHRGLFPRIVFTGANAPTTVERFPRGEAVHYSEYALNHGVPDSAILVEPRATNTSENITFSMDLLDDYGVNAASVILVSRPYQQRRAYATAKKLYPAVSITCSSQRLSLLKYVESIGDSNRVINMLVGDTQRIAIYADRGFSIHQAIPPSVEQAYQHLVEAGFTDRLVPNYS